MITDSASLMVQAISPLADVPHFADVPKNHPLSDLFSGGWLEGAW